jgi:hypothetical protein
MADDIGAAYAPQQPELVATNILNERRARKLAQDDANRLYNRVRQLHREEDKAKRRIADTRRKAREIVAFRERNELTRQEKATRAHEAALMVAQQRETNLLAKEATARAKFEHEARILETKLSQANTTKEERVELEMRLEEARTEWQREAAEARDAVVRAHEEGRRKIEALKMDRLLMVSIPCCSREGLGHLKRVSCGL